MLVPLSLLVGMLWAKMPKALVWAHTTQGKFHRHFPTTAAATVVLALVVLIMIAELTSAAISRELLKNSVIDRSWKEHGMPLSEVPVAWQRQREEAGT